MFPSATNNPKLVLHHPNNTKPNPWPECARHFNRAPYFLLCHPTTRLNQLALSHPDVFALAITTFGRVVYFRNTRRNSRPCTTDAFPRRIVIKNGRHWTQQGEVQGLNHQD